MDTAVICAIVKQEHLYIDEWIQYHLKLGFHHIYLYDNDEEEPHAYIEERYKDKVTVIQFLGKCRQMIAYNKFIREYTGKHRWCAFIDIDEFIVLKHHKNIISFLDDYCQSGAIALNWVLFGSSNHEKYENKHVLERFQRRQVGVDKHVKIIVCLNDTLQTLSPHNCLLINGYTKDCDLNPVKAYFNYQGNDNVACIHHYFTKSKEEYRLKCKRGRADMLNETRTEEEFEEHDRNDIIDTTAYDFFMSHS